jgi:hypothetical protein
MTIWHVCLMRKKILTQNPYINELYFYDRILQEARAQDEDGAKINEHTMLSHRYEFLRPWLIFDSIFLKFFFYPGFKIRAFFITKIGVKC